MEETIIFEKCFNGFLLRMPLPAYGDKIHSLVYEDMNPQMAEKIGTLLLSDITHCMELSESRGAVNKVKVTINIEPVKD